MEVIESFIERGYVNEDTLRSRQYMIGVVHSTLCGVINMLEVVVKTHRRQISRLRYKKDNKKFEENI
jgi:hypothetical protein